MSGQLVYVNLSDNKGRRVPISPPDQFGSGYLIGDGYILTAGHVVTEYNQNPASPDVVSYLDLNNALEYYDIRGWLGAYRVKSNSNPNYLPGQIEAQIINLDIVVIRDGGVDIDSAADGIVVFLSSNDLLKSDFGLVTGTVLAREGKRSGRTEGKILTINYSNSVGQSADFEFDKKSLRGDSGGGYILKSSVSGVEQEFILGTQSASNLVNRSYGNFFTKPEFDDLNEMFEDQQVAGDKTFDEPTNLIVGSASIDGSDSAPITGSYRADIILGRDGNDVFDDGDSANDAAYADDQLFGGEGDDRLIVGAGNNLIHGGDFRKYGGADRVALADDGTDTADFGGSTNGVEIRFPALNAGDPANAGSPAIDTRYKTLLGDDFNSALFVKSRKITSSSEPQFTNTLISIEKIKGSDASDVLYLGETAQHGGAITEVDFAGESGSGYPGGDLVFLGWKDKNVTANFANKGNQTLSGISGLTLKNAESIIATAKDDEIHAAVGGFVIAGQGNDKIHLQAGTFAIGGEGQDEFYVKTKYDGANASFDNDVFILDFNPNEDKLFVDGQLFTGYQKFTQYKLLAEGPNENGHTRRYWAQELTDASTSSFGLSGLDVNLQTYLQLAGGGAAYENGKIRNITVASLDDGSYDNLGRVQFIDIDVAFNQENPTRDEAEVAGNWPLSSIDLLPNHTLNNFLNLHIGQFWQSGQETIKHSIQGILNGVDPIVINENILPVLLANVVEGDDGVGAPPSTLIESFTGFDADLSTYSISSWNNSQSATVKVLLGNDLSGGLGLNASPFAAASVASSTGGTGDSFSFVYDGNLTVTLPVDLSSLDFTAEHSRLTRFDLSKDTIFAFANTLGLREIGILPEKSESISGALGDGRAKIAGEDNVTLEGTAGSDILIGGSGDNVLNAVYMNSGMSQNDLLVGGAGDDTYNVGGVFDKTVISERLESADAAGGFDVLNFDFASDVVSVVEGNDPNDVRLYVDSFLVGGGLDFNGLDPILTIANLRSTNTDDWIEEFRFSDGVTWTRQQLLDNMYSATDFGAITNQLGGDLFSFEDYVIIEPLSNYLTDTLRRNLVYTITLAGGGPAPDWIEVYTDPASGDSWLIGNPPENYFGELDIQIIGSFGSEQANASLRITIDPVNDAPLVTGILEDQFVDSGSISISIPANLFLDVDGDLLSISVTLADGSPLPTWLTFDGATVSGAVPAGFEDVIELRVQASDGDLASVTYFNIFVEPNPNQMPAVSIPLADQVFDEDSTVDVLLPAGAFVDPDGDPLSITASLVGGDPLPSWLNFDGSRFTGMPPLNFNGTLAIEVTASDGEASISDVFNLFINPINDAPIATNDAGYSVTASMPLVIDPFNLVLNDTDIDGDNLSLVSVSAPIGGLVNIGSDGKVIFSASSSFSGNGGFSYTITDGNLTSSATVSVTVQPDVAWTYGTAGNDTIIGSANNRNRIDGLAGSDNIYGGSLNDELVGGDSNDNLYGNAGDDILRGGNGDDFLYPGVGTDLIDGGVGTDRVLYSAATSGVAFSLLNGGTAGDALGDTYVSIEYAAGSNFNDTIEGDNLANGLFGLDGDDELIGLDGNDILQGGNGADILRGGGGNDTMIADRTDNAADTFYGDAGDDFIVTGNLDVAHGGDGNDQIDIRGSNGAVYGGNGVDDIDLMANVTNVSIDGGAGYDYLDGSSWDISVSSLSSIESISGSTDINNSFAITINSTNLNLSATSFIWYLDLIAGTNADTTIIGPGAVSNPMPARLRIYGAAGNDSLTGSLVADHLTGGAGNDFLAGNTGSDIAYFSGTIGTYSIVTSGGAVTVVDNESIIDGNDGTDTISSIEQLNFQGGVTVNVASPIILDLDGNGVKTISAADSKARYDLDGDGLADDTSWIGNTEGFLFLDRDGNGTVTNADEFSFIDDVVGARSDLEGLRAFDSNKDGILSSLDAKFTEFKVWQDRDGDGAVEDGETLTLTQAGVRSINLKGTAVNGSTPLGEVVVVNKGSYTRTNGSTMEFLDAALTYFSSATNMPALVVRELDFSQTSKHFSINFAGGQLTVAPNKRKGQIDARAGALGASSLLSFRNQTVGMLSPIILDLDGDGIEMRSIKKSKAAFDMNGDGALDHTGWTGKGDGFLVIDRNNDGLITHASELSFASEDLDAASDLEALAALDNNGDRVIDAKDVRFGELKVWVDADGDGVTDAGELKTLAEVGIASMSLVGRNLEGRADVGDNILLGTSTFTRANGATGTVGNAVLAHRPGTDVSFGAGSANEFYNARVFEALEHAYPFDESSNVGLSAIADNADALVESLRSGQRSSDGQFNWKLPVNIDPFDHFGVSEAQLQATPDRDRKDFVSGVAEVIEDDAEFHALTTTESAGRSGTERLLALIRQDMATFGVVGSENSSPWRRDHVNRHVDFYA